MLLRKKNSDIILKTMTNNEKDFIRIRGSDEPILHPNRRYKREDARKAMMKKKKKLEAQGVIIWNTPGFVISCAPSRFNDDNITPNGKKIVRVAFLASKKTVGKYANWRNNTKRRLRVLVNDLIRENLNLTYDYIFVAKKEFMRLPMWSLQKEFIWASKHVNRLIDEKIFGPLPPEDYERNKLDNALRGFKNV